jgi:hypothetical protein
MTGEENERFPSPRRIVELIGMLRIGLSVYLMLAMLVEPLFCCCQMSRLSAEFVQWMRNGNADAVASAPSCCRPHVPTKPAPTQPEKPSCPCGGSSSKILAFGAAESEGVVQLDRDPNAPALDRMAGAFLSSLPTLSTAKGNVSSTVFFPFASGRDLLSSLHILRC